MRSEEERVEEWRGEEGRMGMKGWEEGRKKGEFSTVYSILSFSHRTTAATTATLHIALHVCTCYSIIVVSVTVV